MCGHVGRCFLQYAADLPLMSYRLLQWNALAVDIRFAARVCDFNGASGFL